MRRRPESHRDARQTAKGGSDRPAGRSAGDTPVRGAGPRPAREARARGDPDPGPVVPAGAPVPRAENGAGQRAWAPSEDETLMRRVAAGEEAAVTELYDRFASLVYRMAHQVLSNRGELDDVMQEVFVILWRTAARYDASRAALVTWVMLITRRRLVDRLRRRHRMDEWTREAGTPQTQPCDAVLEQDDEFDRLMRRIKALPELQQTVLTRVYLHGQTLRQIGEHLKTPLGTIKTALNRGLSRLRAEVNEPGDGAGPAVARGTGDRGADPGMERKADQNGWTERGAA